MWGAMLGPPRTPPKAWKSAVSAGTAFSQRSAPELIEANHPTTQVKRSLLPWQQMGSDNKMNSHFWSSKNSFCFALSPVIWTTPSNTSQITQLKTQSTFKKTQTGWKVCGKVTVPEKARLMAFACVHRTTHASIFPLQAAGWVQRNLPKCLTHVHTVFFSFFKLSLWTKHWERLWVNGVRHQGSLSSCFGSVRMKTLDISWQVNRITRRITRCWMAESSWPSHHVQEIADF